MSRVLSALRNRTHERGSHHRVECSLQYDQNIAFAGLFTAYNSVRIYVINVAEFKAAYNSLPTAGASSQVWSSSDNGTLKSH